MNKTIIIAIIVLLGLGGIGYYIYSQNQSGEVPLGNMLGGNEESMEAMDDQDLDFTGNITQLLKLGKNVQCDFSYEDTGNSTKGRVYMANNGQRMRGDFDLETADGETMTSGMIRDNDYSYVWSSSFDQGYKMKIEKDEDLFDTENFKDNGSGSNGLIDPNENVDYRCKAWRVDDSKFSPPSDVDFVDFTQGMENLQNNLDQYLDDKCSACDALSGEAQNQCLQALGC